MEDMLTEQGFDVVAAGAFIAQHSLFPEIAVGRPDEQDIKTIDGFAKACEKKLAKYKHEKFAAPEIPGTRPYRERSKKVNVPTTTMNDVYPGDARYILDAFCISKGNIEAFDLAQHPIDRQTFAFGGAGIKEKGFEVKEKYCTGCGVCKKQCPQGCISIKGTAHIASEHCLHCGLCREVCPSGAIKRK